QVERAADPWIHVGERDREERQHERRDRHREAPEELGALDGPVEKDQRRGGNGFRRRGQRAQLRRLDPASERAEFHDLVIGGAGLAFVAASVGEHDEAVAVRALLKRSLPGDGRRVLALVDRVEENVANGPVERVDALDENDQLRAAELAEKARREQRDLVAGLELALVLEATLLGPRRQVEREHE